MMLPNLALVPPNVLVGAMVDRGYALLAVFLAAFPPAKPRFHPGGMSLAALLFLLSFIAPGSYDAQLCSTTGLLAAPVRKTSFDGRVT